MNNAAVRKSKNVMSRDEFLKLLDATLACADYRFGRQAILSWLAIYPGDLQVALYHAEMLAGDHKESQALTVLEKLLQQDAEYLDAYQVLARLTYSSDPVRFKTAVSSMKVLGAEVPGQTAVEDWTANLLAAQELAAAGKVGEAQEQLNPVLGLAERPLLACVRHLELVAQGGDAQTVSDLADVYLAQYPKCLNLLLFKVEALMEMGAETEAVHLLHQCVSMDAAGQAAQRQWGKEHAYKSIWPDNMTVLFDLPIPAEVAVRLRGAWLPMGGAGNQTNVSAVESTEQPSQAPAAEAAEASEAAPEKAAPKEERLDRSTLAAIEAEIERLAKNLKRPAIGRSDGRYPVYVIFSSMKGLQKQYGPQTSEVIDLELRRLGEAVKKRLGWEALVFYPDDEGNVTSLGLKPVDGSDPWKLKLALADLDQALAKKGEMIGMLLIVGGPQVVPFHELPNPTDDYDAKIQSDNPYATLDSNYFVPSWPVGRLPGSTGSDAALLLEQLRFLIAYHNRAQSMKGMSKGSVLWPFLVLIQSLVDTLSTQKETPNVGYSAAVWRRSSTAVFRTIGNPTNLMVSPPEDSKTLEAEKLLTPEISYFNLHGMEDGAEWYGQRDPTESDQGPDYPVALSPSQLKRNGHAPRVVFSEACYGGHILNKTEETAISLKFLSLGALAVVGSTCIAYGSVSTPLIAADLLGNYFWQQMKNGRTAGEALMLAKIDLAKEMINRQGYLDGEDQKTLLSFVLYGDPLALIDNNQKNPKRAKMPLRLKKSPQVKVVAQQEANLPEQSPVAANMIEEVKSKLSRYLPGLETAEIHVSAQGEGVAAKKGGAKQSPYGQCYVVTVSKQVPFARSIHRHYAQATVTPEGRVIKLAVSR